MSSKKQHQQPSAPPADSKHLPWFKDSAVPRSALFPEEAKEKQNKSKNENDNDGSRQQQQQQQQQQKPQDTSAAAAAASSNKEAKHSEHHDEDSSDDDIKKAAAGNDSITPKSLWLCLVLRNPYHLARKKEPHMPPDGALFGYGGASTRLAAAAAAAENETQEGEGEQSDDKNSKKKKSSSSNNRSSKTKADEDNTNESKQKNETFLRDEDFLRAPSFLLRTDLDAPNEFQKIIELLLRISKRGLHTSPPVVGRLVVDAAGNAPPADEPWNFLEGFSLGPEENFLLSPDGDEIYLKVHASKSALQLYAERAMINMRSNPYSIGGGVGMSYNRKLDKKFAATVEQYKKHGWGVAEGDEFCAGKRLSASSSGSSASSNGGGGAFSASSFGSGRGKASGFIFDVNQKQRILLRFFKAGWMYNGLGLSLDAMKKAGKKSVLVDYFFLHNKAYADAYGVTEFCSPSSLCSKSGIMSSLSMTPQQERALLLYFGEQIALYFSFLVAYSRSLLVPAAVGVVAGIVMAAEVGEGIVGALFSLFLLVSLASFAQEFSRLQQRFSYRYGQEVEQRSEPVRDNFECDKKLATIPTVLALEFEVPFAAERTDDGTLVEFVFPRKTRQQRRYFVSYPIILLLAATMLAGLFFVQVYRFSDAGNVRVSVAASIASVAITAVFGKVFAIAAELLTEYENCSTDTEYESELIVKSVAFYFISSYAATLFILFWPDTDPNSPDESRKQRDFELKSQLLIALAGMPIVQNVVELLLPSLMRALRRRVDETGGICSALCSFICCCCYSPEGNDGDGSGEEQQEQEQQGGDTMSNSSSSNNSPQKNKKQHQQRFKKNELSPTDPAFQPWSESSMEKYNGSLEKMEDSLEVVISFGWMCLFGGIFPWAPILSLFFFCIEVKLDAMKLLFFYQRPVSTVAQSLGPYYPILALLLIAGSATNTYYFAFVSRMPEQLGFIDSGAVSKPRSDAQNAVLMELFVWMQYILAGAVGLFLVLRKRESSNAAKVEHKKVLMRDRLIQDKMAQLLKMDNQELKEYEEAKVEQLRQEQDESAANRGEPASAGRLLKESCCCCCYLGEDGDDDEENDQQEAAAAAAAAAQKQRHRQNQQQQHQQKRRRSSSSSKNAAAVAPTTPRQHRARHHHHHNTDAFSPQDNLTVLAAIESARQQQRDEQIHKATVRTLKSPSSRPDDILMQQYAPSTATTPRALKNSRNNKLHLSSSSSDDDDDDDNGTSDDGKKDRAPSPYERFVKRQMLSDDIRGRGFSHVLSERRRGKSTADDLDDDPFIREMLGNTPSRRRQQRGAAVAAHTTAIDVGTSPLEKQQENPLSEI